MAKQVSYSWPLKIEVHSPVFPITEELAQNYLTRQEPNVHYIPAEINLKLPGSQLIGHFENVPFGKLEVVLKDIRTFRDELGIQINSKPIVNIKVENRFYSLDEPDSFAIGILSNRKQMHQKAEECKKFLQTYREWAKGTPLEEPSENSL